MSDLAGRILPLALAVAGREHDGKTARLVLTGDGGGDWLVADGRRRARGRDARRDRHRRRGRLVPARRRPRSRPTELRVQIDGDPELGRDLVAAAPALATL